jgi:hypothetical protein
MPRSPLRRSSMTTADLGSVPANAGEVRFMRIDAEPALVSG